MGVVEAVRRFDPERGIRLSSYTAWWIRAYQLRYLMANYRLVKIGSTQQQRKISGELDAESRVEQEELVSLLREEAAELRGELDGRVRALLDARFCDEAPTLADLGRRFGVSRERARQLESRVLGRLRTRVERRIAA